ncbi:DUF1461 domain-containing protein, partial [Candidatus Woesearchaeota archaeon]|nr:DUF1461 domain-containing protein [Candidatus Woesearchaeota archaeon]
RIDDHKQILSYIDGGRDLDLDMTSQEKSHLKDVRNVCTYGKLLTIFLLILTITLLIKNKTKNKTSINKIIKSLLIPSSITLILFVIIFTFQKTSFIIFHKIFFLNQNWQFPYDSFLITLYPEQYFFEIFLIILIRFYFFIFLIIFLSKLIFNQKPTKITKK